MHSQLSHEIRCGPLLLIALCSLPILTALLITPTFAATSETKGWTINYQISSDRAEPGGQLQLSFRISVKTQAYDFELWVRPGSPLSVDRDGHIHVASLSPGEMRQEGFTVFVPTAVAEGEIYVVNFRAQSYPDPAPLWGRIGESPDNVMDTTEKPEFAMKVTIVARPRLAIVSFSANPSSASVGDKLTVTAVVQNVGTGTVHAVSCMLQIDPRLSLSEGSERQSIGDLAPGQTRTVSWKISAQDPGKYTLTVDAEAADHPKVSGGAQTIDISLPWWQRLQDFLPVIFMVILILVILALAFGVLAKAY